MKPAYGSKAYEDNFEEDDDGMSDRMLLLSADSRAGVNVPLNSLPKLSRHNKSDLNANELEGDP